MDKKIIITGHTSGIGSAIYDKFKEISCREIVGMSRSNGYDIDADFDKIVEEENLNNDNDYFDKNFSELDPEKYVVEILVKKLKAKIILIGYDHKFGKNRTADISDLKEYGEKYGFKVIEIKAEEISNIAISSTKIRKAISEGNISTAKKYLGYDFSLSGRIVHGNSIGRTLGFPTANIKVKEEYKLHPKNGVYLIESIINKKQVFGMMNIGIKPTLDKSSKTIEVNFFEFEGDLYNTKITVSIKQFIRDEIKFDSLELLKSQIQKDKINCNSIIDIID